MALSPETMKILENVYWFVCSAVLGAIVYICWKQNKQVESVLLGIIGASAIFYFWIKWFKIPNTEDGNWPPFISPCPDYLSLVAADTTGDTKPVCMDFVGVSTQPNVLMKTNPKRIPQASDSDYNSYVFVVAPSSQGQTSEEYSKQTCLKVQAAGLTWEGVCE
jgi:hypothetical protein